MGGKRERDETDEPSKRVRMDLVEPPDAVYLKMLIPNKETGIVIGKGGLVLKRVIEESGARVRISAADEMLPNTGERVATVSGTLPNVMRAQQLICAVMHEPKPGQETAQPVSQERVFKMLVPNSGAGVVIGKQGMAIKSEKFH